MEECLPDLASASTVERLLHTVMPPTRSTLMMEKAGRRLGLSDWETQELIAPAQVRALRLSVPVGHEVLNVWGVVALHNMARGPFKGGIRLAEDVDLLETLELARIMTLKTAVTGVEFGGGKSGISLSWPNVYQRCGRDPNIRDLEFEKDVSLEVISRYARRVRSLIMRHEYIPAPDMGTSPEHMAMIYNETLDPASVTGKPRNVHGWLPGRREATGWGVAESLLYWLERVRRDPRDTTISLQGFGNVGSYAARFLAERGVRVLAIADAFGGIYNPEGIDVPGLCEHTARTGSVFGFPAPHVIDGEGLFDIEVDAFIPAAVGNAVTRARAERIRCQAIIEGANMPVSQEAFDVLGRRKIAVLPDMIVNAGGVIASMEEYSKSLSAALVTKQAVFDIISLRIRDALRNADQLAQRDGITMTEAAIEIALERVYDAMRTRRFL